MDAEDFFSRWSRRNAEAAAERQAVPEPVLPPPTLEDVASLTPDSDFSRFVARGVDENVRRTAMKKLFADPRFNVMDGLDVYIEDYHSYTPIPAAMLAVLQHARTLLDPLGQEETREEQESKAAEDTHESEHTLKEEQSSHGDPVQGM